jgi:prepilin-type N-terminal cleavage/methylation domain-containing protein
MTDHPLLKPLQRFWAKAQKRQHQAHKQDCESGGDRGFTLIELLIVSLIGAGIITGLTYIMIELLNADQRETSRTDTQREMQLALDYIASDMREAVFVYTGDCLDGDDSGDCPERSNAGSLLPYIPASLSSNGSVPIVAFWRQEPLPRVMREACSQAYADTNSVPCITANSYALVVYSLQRDVNNADVWDGRARITRYILTEFPSSGAAIPNAGYVNPGRFDNFGSWPWGRSPTTGQQANLQAELGVGVPTGTPQVLVDFVDDGVGSQAAGIPAGDTSGGNTLCPSDDYSISPPRGIYDTAFGGLPRSFFACVRDGGIGENQETLLVLRGNADGRPGVANSTAFLPTMETRVLSRGVLQR